MVSPSWVSLTAGKARAKRGSLLGSHMRSLSGDMARPTVSRSLAQCASVSAVSALLTSIMMSSAKATDLRRGVFPQPHHERSNDRLSCEGQGAERGSQGTDCCLISQ